MKDFLRKFKSRKFLTCVAGVVMGACMIFGIDMNTADTIAGAVVAASSIATYIYAEGKIDAATAGKIQEIVKDTVNAVEDIEE